MPTLFSAQRAGRAPGAHHANRFRDSTRASVTQRFTVAGNSLGDAVAGDASAGHSFDRAGSNAYGTHASARYPNDAHWSDRELRASRLDDVRGQYCHWACADRRHLYPSAQCNGQ